MHIDFRSGLRTASALVGGMAVVGIVACGGGAPSPAPAPSAPPAPKVLTAAERAGWYQSCWGYFDDRNWDKFRTCYADSVSSDQVDSGKPVATGIDAVVAGAKVFSSQFPDVKGTGQLILINGDSLVSEYVINGTFTGPFIGPDGKTTPPTKKPIGLLQAHLIQADVTGDKVLREEFYLDAGTMMAQMGLSPAPARPVMKSTAVTPIVAIASGSATEKTNVEAVKAQIDAFNRHDAKGMDVFNAADAVLRDTSAPKDQTPKESLAGTVEMYTGFPDAKLISSSVWAAGDYVVSLGRFEGTNRGAVPSMGIKKATGKAVTVRFLEITRWENGKIKTDTLYYNGMAFASQLGLMGK